jgi:Tol biopolymer transport system component
MKNLTSGAFTRLAGMGNYNYRPAWSPDGKFVAFTSDQDGPMTTYIVPADGSASPRRLLPSQPTVDEVQFSRDGRWIVFRAGSGGGRDLRAQRTDGDTTSIGIATSRFEEFSPALSPDGKWVAYASDETGRTEVFVRPFPNAGEARYAVSSAGGSEPLWANSGRELFFRDGADNLVAVSVALGERFSAGPARVLFSAKPYLTEFRHRMYAVSADDRSFLFVKRGEDAALNHVMVTLNWFEELKAKVK